MGLIMSSGRSDQLRGGMNTGDLLDKQRLNAVSCKIHGRACLVFEITNQICLLKQLVLLCNSIWNC